MEAEWGGTGERAGAVGGDRAASPLDRLEADLALQAAGLAGLDRDADVAERTRAERASVALTDRLRAAAESDPPPRIRLGVLGRPDVEGVVRDVGRDHVLVVEGARRSWVAVDAVQIVAGLPRVAAPPGGVVAAAWGLSAVLRRLAADGTAVRLWGRDGSGRDGTLRYVGADHVDLELHPLDDRRGSGAGHRRVTLAIGALTCVEAPPP